MKKVIVAAVLAVAGSVGLTFAPECRITNAIASVAVTVGAAPVNLDEFSRYRLPYRRALFNKMSVEQKRSLWLEQLAEVRHTPGLSADQLAFLNEAADFI